MTVDEARAAALRQDGAIEGAHHGHPDFRVGTSIFATLWPAEDRSVLRLPEAFAESLERDEPQKFKVVSRSRGQGWVSVQLAQIDQDEFFSLVGMAHQHLMAGKRK